jgi:alkylated DNA repair dioxygenase AlkB/uncharacterized Zn-finger protein
MTQDVSNRIKELEVLKAREEIVTEPFINSPFTYEENFYTREETAELLDACAKLDFVRQKTPWKLEKRYAVIAFGDSGGRPYNAEVRPLSEAPDAIKKLLAKLSAYSGKNVNYASAVRYVDGTDYMGWHQHREDRGHDATVWIVSTGAERLFGLRDIETKHVFKFTVKPGSLITLSSEANDTHEHAVLKMPGCKSVRYAVNCKAISPREPQVYDCHAGKEYPADAVYVGREVRDRKGKLIREASPFGNPHLPPEEFRAYAEEKMKDAAFAAQVMALKGKDLLCWCSGKETEHCHARVWLELANRNAPEEPNIPADKARTKLKKPVYREGVDYAPAFLSPAEADELLELMKSQPFADCRVSYGPQVFPPPRKSNAWKDRYALATNPQPEPELIRLLRLRLSERYGVPFNSVQCNWHGGNSGVKAHYDPYRIVAMIRLGATRTFEVGDQRRKGGRNFKPYPMPHGSLITFLSGGLAHRMFPDPATGDCVSLVFRLVTPPQTVASWHDKPTYGKTRAAHKKLYDAAVSEYRSAEAKAAESAKALAAAVAAATRDNEESRNEIA